MTKPGDKRKGDAAELEDLARRFQDLWRDQMAAMAADPDIAGMMNQWMAAFGGMARPPAAPAPFNPADPAAWMAAFAAGMPGAAKKDQRNERAEPPAAAPSGAPPAVAASGAGDVAGDKLERRLADLERRLERLEARIGGKGGGARARTRRGKS